MSLSVVLQCNVCDRVIHWCDSEEVKVYDDDDDDVKIRLNWDNYSSQYYGWVRTICHTHPYISTHTSTYIHTHIHTFTHSHTYIKRHTHIHTLAHMHAHTHTHVPYDIILVLKFLQLDYVTFLVIDHFECSPLDMQ